MSLRTMESAITWEAREVFKNRKLRVKDLREWSTGKIEPQDGEVAVFLPLNKVNVAILKEHDKRGSGA